MEPLGAMQTCLPIGPLCIRAIAEELLDEIPEAATACFSHCNL